MFSEVQRAFIKQFVDTYRKEYPYYLAYSRTYFGASYDTPDLYIYLSKEPITASNLYSYSFTGDCIGFSVITRTASNSYYAKRIDTVTVPNFKTVDNYEFVYTNAEFTGYQMQPDINATREVTTDVYQGVSIALLIVLLSVVFYRLIRR